MRGRLLWNPTRLAVRETNLQAGQISGRMGSGEKAQRITLGWRIAVNLQ